MGRYSVHPGRDRSVRRGLKPLVSLLGLASVVCLPSCGGDDCSNTSSCAGASVVPPPSNVKPNDAFAFEQTPPSLRVERGGKLTVPIAITRVDPRLAQDIRVSMAALLPGVTMDPVTIGGTSTTAELVFNVASDAKQGLLSVNVEGAGVKERATTDITFFVRGKPGEVDTTFGTEGRQTALSATTLFPPTLVVGAADAIFVVGPCGALVTTSLTCAARLTSDGALDATYGGPTKPLGLKNPGAAFVDSSGRLFVGGDGGTSGTFPSVARFTQSGDPDAVYGTRFAPLVSDPPPSGIRSIGVCPDQSFYVGYGFTRPYPQPTVELGISRFSSSGLEDSTFGHVRFNWDTRRATGPTVECDRNNAVRVSAGFQTSSTGFSTQLARFESTGEKDPSFGGANVTRSGVPILLPDGRSLVAESILVDDLSMTYSTSLARILTDGKTLDTAFGVDGHVALGEPADAELGGAVVQSDGKYVVAYVQASGATRVARVEADGKLDASFVTDGLSTTLNHRPVQLAVQSDGRLLVVIHKTGVTGEEDTWTVSRLWN